METLRSKVEDRVVEVLCIAEKRYGPIFDIPEIAFDLKGSSAGQCCKRGFDYRLRFNEAMLVDNEEEFMVDIIPHEVAHYVVRKIHNKSGGHGREWKAVMQIFGTTNPQRCHSLEVTTDLRPYLYVCGCREMAFSQRRHNNVELRGQQYVCGVCKQTVRFVGDRRKLKL